MRSTDPSQSKKRTLAPLCIAILCMGIGGISTQVVAQGQSKACAIANFQRLIDDARGAIEAAEHAAETEKRPFTKVPCRETSKSDKELIASGLKKAWTGLLRGKIPEPFTTALKITFKSSETGTSAGICPEYGLYKEEIEAADRINGLYDALARYGCDADISFRIEVIQAIQPAKGR